MEPLYQLGSGVIKLDIHSNGSVANPGVDLVSRPLFNRFGYPEADLCVQQTRSNGVILKVKSSCSAFAGTSGTLSAIGIWKR